MFRQLCGCRIAFQDPVYWVRSSAAAYVEFRHRRLPARAGHHRPAIRPAKNLGDSVEIRIRDSGTGIPPDVKEKMFNPFFTTKPAGEEACLGLSLATTLSSSSTPGRSRSTPAPESLPNSRSFFRAPQLRAKQEQARELFSSTFRVRLEESNRGSSQSRRRRRRRPTPSACWCRIRRIWRALPEAQLRSAARVSARQRRSFRLLQAVGRALKPTDLRLVARVARSLGRAPSGSGSPALRSSCTG
jgi:Histidine kinase-, DNA gyrase B-, and HSP90-like ATPase